MKIEKIFNDIAEATNCKVEYENSKLFPNKKRYGGLLYFITAIVMLIYICFSVKKLGMF